MLGYRALQIICGGVLQHVARMEYSLKRNGNLLYSMLPTSTHGLVSAENMTMYMDRKVEKIIFVVL